MTETSPRSTPPPHQRSGARVGLIVGLGALAMAGIVFVALVVAWSPPAEPDTPPLRYALWQAPVDLVDALKAADTDNQLNHGFEATSVDAYDRIVVFVQTWPDIAQFPLAGALGLQTAEMAALPDTNLLHSSMVQVKGRTAPLIVLTLSLPQVRARDGACIGPLLRDLMLQPHWGTDVAPFALENYTACPS